MSVERIIRSREQLIQALTEEEEIRYDTNQPFLPIGYFKLIPSSVALPVLPEDLELVNLYLFDGQQYYLYSTSSITLNSAEGILGNIYARSIDIFTLSSFALLQGEKQVFSAVPGTYTLAVPILKIQLPAGWSSTYLSDTVLRIDGSTM